MSGSRAARLAVLTAALALVSVAIGVLYGLGAVVGTKALFPFLLHLAVVPVSATAYALLGGLVAARRPRNPIGWLFLATSLFYGWTTLAVAGSVSPLGALDDGLLASTSLWLASWLWLPATILPTTFLFLLFPDGHLPSRRWRPVAWAVAGGLGATILAVVLHPGPIGVWGMTALNPFGVPWLVPALDLLVKTGTITLLAGLVGCLSAFTLRYRREQGVVRQQLKWLAYAAYLTLAAFGVSAAVWYLSPDPVMAEQIGTTLTGLALLGTAGAAAIAILQYRLYDINLLINRTLVYSALTASVAGLYILLVGLAGAVIQTSPYVPSLILTAFVAVLGYQRARHLVNRTVDRWLARLGWAAGSLDADEPGRGLDRPANAAAEPKWLGWPAGLRKLVPALWVVLAAVAAAVFILSVPGYLQGLGQGPRDMSADISGSLTMVYAFDLASRLASITAVVLSLGLATLLFRRRETHPMALYMSFYLLLFATLMAGPAEAASITFNRPPEDITRLQALLASAPTVILFYIHPNGRFIPPWTRYPAIVSILVSPAFFFLPAMTGAEMASPVLRPFIVLWLILIGVGFYAQVVRYRQTTSKVERQQTRLAVGGLAAWVVMAALMSIPYVLRGQISADQPIPWWGPASETMWFVSFILPPAALAVAVLRYQLWDLGILINRTLVYVALTTAVVGLYVLVVGGLSLFIQSSGGLLVSLVATGLVAVLFQPLRSRVQLGVDRLLYGERDDPYAVLSSLGRRLEAAMVPEAVLPAIVETVAEALKLPYAALALRIGDDERIVAAYGLPRGGLTRVALHYQGERLGSLVCGSRGPNEPFTEDEKTLLQDLGHQAGVALQAVRLTEDLRKSREQLVLAREEERRRLRRDLHDGLGPELASMTLKLDAVRNLMNQDTERAEELLLDLKGQLDSSLTNIRRLVYDLRPPALDELGLVPAVRESSAIRSAGAHPKIRVSGPSHLPPLPAAVEVAAYRVALEAVTNVVRHAAAENCQIHFRIDDELEVEVIDDGRGLSETARSGVGLASMRERAAELGGSLSIGPGPSGGTRLCARFPLTLKEAGA